MWSKSQIRQARKIELAPLLNRLGFRLRPLQNGNILLEDYPDLLVKQHYWTWPTKQLHGNAIDFLVLVEGKSFHPAMQILLVPPPVGSAHICPASRGIENGGFQEKQELACLGEGGGAGRDTKTGHPHRVVFRNDDNDGNKTRQHHGNASKITR